MIEEIRQDGKVILSSPGGLLLPMVFNNLCGRNFSKKEYQLYLKYIAFQEMGFKPGTITYLRDGVLLKTGTIPNL